MKTRYILLIVLSALALNAFAIQRDQKMFQNQEQIRESFCKHYPHASTHPDCNYSS